MLHNKLSSFSKLDAIVDPSDFAGILTVGMD